MDFLTKKHKVNEGEVPQYYIEESHPAIIAPEEWEKVKEEMTRRKAKAGYKGRISPFSGKIICGDCGGTYGSKVWHSNSKYRRVIWQCDKKFEGEEKCRTPHFTEEEFKKCFVRAISEYLTDRESVLDDLRYIKSMMTETDFIDEDIARTDKEIEYIASLKEQCIMQSASAEISDDEYKHRKAEIDEWYNTERRKCDALIRERDRMKETANTISGMLFELTEFEALPIEFKDSLWYAFVDHATIYADDRIVFSLRDGNEISERI